MDGCSIVLGNTGMKKELLGLGERTITVSFGDMKEANEEEITETLANFILGWGERTGKINEMLKRGSGVDADNNVNSGKL